MIWCMILVLCIVPEFNVTGNYQGFGITSCFHLLTACSMFLQTFGNYHKVTQSHRTKIFITNTIPHATMISVFHSGMFNNLFTVYFDLCNACVYHDISTDRKIHVHYKIELISAAIKLSCSILLAPHYIFFNNIILILWDASLIWGRRNTLMSR